MTDHTPAAQPGQDDITARLRENADLDAAEDGNPAVIRMEREAADEIDRLRALPSKLRAPVADGSLAAQALKSAQSNIAAYRPRGSSDPESSQYDHDAFMWDYYQRAIDSLALASAPVADERAKFEAIVKRLGGDCMWRPGYGYVSSTTRLYQNFWRQAGYAVADERAALEYGSPADVAQRIEQHLAHDGRMNSDTQLLYESMKALRSLARGSK